ncbi:MAG: 30S ribosomal protein S4 [Omnitrophica bacterium GWA2_52_8]|nr:MAG: 30S ribosomal protein S4 [Omnitrophica bacterium GWA2_52_8]
MGRYLGPKIRLSRREGINLQLKGSRRNDDKVERRLSRPPGMHGATRRKQSDYGLQLREKQKMKRIYGLLERQFRVFFKRASKKRGVTGEMLISLLERRLDNTVYRLFFANTRNEARQLVGHGHIRVNGKKVNIPSYLVKTGDKITVREKDSIVARIKATLEKWEDLPLPEWLAVNRKSLEGTIVREPTKADAGLPVEESFIVELYSK